MSKQYSVYKGDEELAFGTIDEIAKKLGVNRESVLFYGTNVYKKELAKTLEDW